MVNFGHYPEDSLNHPMMIIALLSIFDLKVTKSILTNLFFGTIPMVKSQSLKLSKDLAKNCINSTQHFLITQTQKKHLIRNNARFKELKSNNIVLNIPGPTKLKSSIKKPF